MYIETSSPRKPGDNAKISRMVTLSGKSCLKFYYHMYGGHMGELEVKLCDRVIFSKSGNQGNQWNMHQLNLQGAGSKEVRAKITWQSIRQHTITRQYKLRQNCANSVISFTLLLYQSRSQSFVPHDQRWENESSGSNHFEITKEITQFCPSGSLRSLHLWRMPEMVALVFRPLVKGNE